MLNNPTIEKLMDLKLKVMAQMMKETEHNFLELSFEERLGIMVEKEWLAKKNARIKRLLRNASLGLTACIEDIDYSSQRTIDKQVIKTLSTCAFIEQKLNIIISGKTGSGKSYLACAFGNNACRQGYTVKYFRIPGLLLEIEHAKSENRYAKFMAGLQKVKLLILDDIGLKSYSLEESRDILEIAEARYNQGSTILAGQIPHAKWYNLFPDPTIADAIMDRFIHNSYILVLDSKQSMRAVTAEKIIQDTKKGN
ncbi:MAG: IS21-like element helper ATPase IstB [Alkaliphilus sp.]|nr:IS21-like element helper ATPase IstB [Alkaliphilus sp.]